MSAATDTSPAAIANLTGFRVPGSGFRVPRRPELGEQPRRTTPGRRDEAQRFRGEAATHNAQRATRNAQPGTRNPEPGTRHWPESASTYSRSSLSMATAASTTAAWNG